MITYQVEVHTQSTTPNIQACVIDTNGATIQCQKGLQRVIVIPEVHLWWPFAMSDTSGYLYTLQVV